LFLFAEAELFNNYEPSDAILVRNEMSCAADNFHPGFSPESSLMSLSLAGLLARAASLEPSRLHCKQWH
jgi:hypothetical protein